MSGKIFINYRRGDDPGNTGRLFDQLAQEFPSDQLFMDVEGGMTPGDAFVQVLETQVAPCDVLLSVLGQGSLAATDETAAGRLATPDDCISIGLAAAMRRTAR